MSKLPVATMTHGTVATDQIRPIVVACALHDPSLVAFFSSDIDKKVEDSST
jgi:hypothetical protein